MISDSELWLCVFIEISMSVSWPMFAIKMLKAPRYWQDTNRLDMWGPWTTWAQYSSQPFYPGCCNLGMSQDRYWRRMSNAFTVWLELPQDNRWFEEESCKGDSHQSAALVVSNPHFLLDGLSDLMRLVGRRLPVFIHTKNPCRGNAREPLVPQEKRAQLRNLVNYSLNCSLEIFAQMLVCGIDCWPYLLWNMWHCMTILKAAFIVGRP